MLQNPHNSSGVDHHLRHAQLAGWHHYEGSAAHGRPIYNLFLTEGSARILTLYWCVVRQPIPIHINPINDLEFMKSLNIWRGNLLLSAVVSLLTKSRRVLLGCLSMSSSGSISPDSTFNSSFPRYQPSNAFLQQDYPAGNHLITLFSRHFLSINLPFFCFLFDNNSRWQSWEWKLHIGGWRSYQMVQAVSFLLIFCYVTAVDKVINIHAWMMQQFR